MRRSTTRIAVALASALLAGATPASGSTDAPAPTGKSLPQGVSRDSCAGCHPKQAAQLASTWSRHKPIPCWVCHRGEHGSTEKCAFCHRRPHPDDRGPDCGACHGTAHDLTRN